MQLIKREGKRGFSWTIRWREGKKRYSHALKDVKDEKIAEIAFNDFVKRRERGVVGLPTDPRYTLREALDLLLDSRDGVIKEPQQKQLKARAARLCAILGDGAAVAKLDDGDLARVRRELLAEDMKPPTINKYLTILAAAGELATRKGIIERNPLRGFTKLSDGRAPVWRFLTEEEIETLYRALEGGYAVEGKSRMGNSYETHWDAPAGMADLVTFLLNTGARIGEALACKWRDVDFKAAKVRLVATKKAARGRKAEVRHIPLNAALRGLLERLRAEHKPTSDDPVLTINHHNLLRKFQNLCERIGLGHVRIHDLRHSFCSHLAMAGVPIPTIKELAGHATIAMTMRYAHLIPGKTQTAVDTLNFGASDAPEAKVVNLE